MRNLLLAVSLTGALILMGCATTARDNKVEFRVKSDPEGCPVEVNGVNMGTTPTSIYLGVSKHWVGLAFSSDGWDYGNETYHVTCFPPPQSDEGLISQTKVVQPRMTPSGADLYFNLRLKPYVPTQPIDIQQRTMEDITIKDERTGPPSEDATTRLKKLKELLEQGFITDEEYQRKRDEILRSL
jgi:hypothetical protein